MAITSKIPGTVDTSKPTAFEKKKHEKWSLSNLPPAGHEDVGPFAYDLYLQSKAEKERLSKPSLWSKNYKFFKGNHWDRNTQKSTKATVNLFFANVIRTVANIVNRDPIAEVADLTGKGGDRAKIATKKLEKWWIETRQHQKLRASDINNEVYGITIEKPYWNAKTNSPDTTIIDPYAFFPAPGYWEDISLDCPYVCHANPQPVGALKKKYDKEDISSDDYYYDLGMDREEHMPVQTSGGTVSTVYESGGRTYANRVNQTNQTTDQALEIEIWVRDNSQCDCKPIYPGGVRCITICNAGKVVLDDRKNPNINWAFEESKYKTNYLFQRLPFFKANSYEDTSSIWGFSALDQTYELAVKVEELLSMAIAYHQRSAYGVMVIGKRTGIKRSQLSNKPGLVLFPDSDVDQVKFVPLPNLPSSYFNLINLMIELHDRIYAVQDADRGESPNGIVAASAIVALQEKNAVLIQHKIDAVEKLIEARGNCAIALYQMHGHIPETIEVEGETFTFKGTDTAGDDFNYVVQSGSTQIQTQAQRQERSVGLYEKGAIDQQALLEDLNYPKMKQVLERTAENQLDQALTLLVQAGLPEELALQLKSVLAEAQTESSNQTEEAQPVAPRAYQGTEADAENVPQPQGY